MKEKTVIAFGSFDVLHPGHLHYLRSASTYGRLIVVVARDDSILKAKGRRPLIDQKSRLELISSVRFVWRAVLGNRIEKKDDRYKVLLRFKPDYIALGYDQKADMERLKNFIVENGLRSRIIRIGAYKSRTFKSMKLKKLMGTY
ncbi:MAG: FAD synthase [Candidatus Micrarchaeota archaeon]|nr:FAD synthase [Candidatus Micrarchaeota archaeon]MDE1834115.1 FAD synthase [Candidatus Micrarchaeota archaeon]MDE1859030.1 FAD synthase [Candidatus Micrarchaeota archaeon]